MSGSRPGRPTDDGLPDARLAAALAAYDGSPPAVGELLAALSGARVFLALAASTLPPVPAARAQPWEAAPRGQESAAQMSVLSLRAESGARALPTFAAGVDVQRWRPAARPVPVGGAQACATALEDGASALLLDPLGVALPVGADWLRELAAGRVPVVGADLSTRRAPLPPGAGEPVAAALLQALAAALAGEPVRTARLLAGSDGVPVLAVSPTAAMSAADAAAMAERVRSRLGADLPATGLDLALTAEATPASGQLVPLPTRGRAGRVRGLVRRRRAGRPDDGTGG